MENWRPSSVYRFAIMLIVICGLLGQTSLSSAMAAHSLNEATCAQLGQPTDLPAGEHHPHGDCCILASASFGWFILAAAALVLYPARSVSSLAFGADITPAAQKPERFYLTARGPPLAV
ncbi:hypothetical protein SAMN05444581_11582 [Methylocapsa palsarum]|uniref:DUF2946 domain-containing protein n=2 Tax=Methylocapsa palsarum TaxID=1612308 RepID=A0A1I4BKZ1_9HYPH|nr:hypothetical protein SAMN05444581_11582 [Methylocapsa palsarum]